jgi:CubicO group peptidase (beta-lactamase class C family)
VSPATLGGSHVAHFSNTLKAVAAGAGSVYAGAVVHVRVEGEVVCEGAFGTLTPAGRPVLVDSPFDLASITKLFAGSTLLALLDRRCVALDDPVVSIVPEFAGQDARRTAVTVGQLLAHTSGLPAHVSFRDEVGARAIVARVCSTPLASTPGTTVTYSDLGFILVGAAIERLSGLALDEAIAHHVTRPMRLQSARFNPASADRASIVCTERDSWRGRLLQGEVHDENCWSMGGISGHAGLFANAADVAALGELYRSGGATEAGRVLSRHSARRAIAEAARGSDERRGLAWALRTDGLQSCGTRFGPDSFGHTGYTGTSLWVDPERALTVCLLTNRVYFTRDPSPVFELRVAVHEAVIDDLVRLEHS